MATDVKAEKRFLSTIARRLDTLGAITRGQRQTGGQGLFRPEDNLESPYARDALRQLYRRIYRGDVAGCPLGAFEDATGLSLTDDNGLKDDLPPITTFLNRLLALTIDMQAVLFSAFEELLDQRIEGAKLSATIRAFKSSGQRRRPVGPSRTSMRETPLRLGTSIRCSFWCSTANLPQTQLQAGMPEMVSGRNNGVDAPLTLQT